MTRYRHLITDENRKWWTLGAMCFALFMIMLDNTVVNVALPSIERDLGASLSSLEWTINGYTLVVRRAARHRRAPRRHLRPAADLPDRRDAVHDLVGDRRAGAPTRPRWSPAGSSRGSGGALMMPATLSIVTNAFPPSERGKAIGTWAGVSALALAIGPVLGGFLTEHVSWRAIFFINVPVGVGAVLASLFAVRESRDETVGREVDYPGVATLTAGLTALVLALIEGNSWGWGSPAIVALLAGSVVMLAALRPRRAQGRCADGRVPRCSRAATSSARTWSRWSSRSRCSRQFFFLALYMQNILGYSPLEAGVRFLPATLMIVAIAPLAGRLTDRIGARIPIAVGLSLVSAAMFWLTRIDPRDDLRRPAALVRAHGHRHGARDVPDVDGGDERRRRRQGRDRLRDPVDEPDDRRHARRRGGRRRLPGRRPFALDELLARIGAHCRPAQRHRAGSRRRRVGRSRRAWTMLRPARWPRPPTTPSSAPSPPR